MDIPFPSFGSIIPHLSPKRNRKYVVFIVYKTDDGVAGDVGYLV
jgi:hypothetical protein